MRIFHNVTEADRRLWKAPLVSQLFPFLWAEPHHAGVSLFCEYRSWLNDFSKGRSQITAWVALFPLWKRSWRTVSVALWYHKRICLLYSVVKEQWRKPQKASMYKRQAGQERGGECQIISRRMPLFFCLL